MILKIIIGVLLFKTFREIPKKFRCFCCTELSNVWNIFHFFITILISGPVYRNITTSNRPRILLHRIDPEQDTRQHNLIFTIDTFNFYDTNPTPTNFFYFTHFLPVFLSYCLILFKSRITQII